MARPLAVLLPAFWLAACAQLAEHHPAPHPTGVLARQAQRLNADGTLPENNIARMIVQRERMLAAQPLAAGGPTNWRWLGPGNIGGRIRAILIHPTRTSEMWIGSASGGIWHTTNGGTSWAPQDGFPSVLPIGSLAFDPSDPNTIYAGTGEGVFDSVAGTSNLAAPRGSGIHVTHDGGKTWKQLASTAGPLWYFVNRITFSADKKVMLAATGRGIFRSTDRGRTFSRRTTRRTTDVDFHPADPKLAIAGTIDAKPQYSTDGGLTWKTATMAVTPQRSEVAYARSSPSTVYAAVARSGRIRIYRSSDGGRSYGLMTSGSGIQLWSRYNDALWVDPTDPAYLIVAGVRLYRSTNGGRTLARADAGVHADLHWIVEHPGYDGRTNQTVFVGSDGGIFRTGNARSSFPSWTSLNHNLGITQFYGAAISPASGTVMGGTQDNGTLRYNGGANTWSKTFGGDGGFAAADRTDSRVFYGEYQRLGLFRSTNSGRGPVRIIKSGIRETRTNFIPAFVLDPNDQKRMLAAGAQLWRSNDVKNPSRPVWTSIKPALSCPADGGGRAGHFAVDPPCNISAITIAEGDSNVIWVGHNNGRLYRTGNGLAASPTWTRVDTGAPGLPKRWIARIAIDRRDHKRVTVALMGYQPDNLWRTADNGKTWQRITGSGATALPSAPVTSVALHRVIPGLLYAGNDVGLYWSADDGKNWATGRAGAGIAPVEEIVWQNDRTLMVVTHGRGIYLADSGSAAAVKRVGSGCGIGGKPTLTATPPRLGARQTYLLVGAAASRPVSLLLAPGKAVATNLGGGCILQVDPRLAVVIPAGGTNPVGIWSLSVAVPRDPAALGVVLAGQVFVSVPRGPVLGLGELSSGVEMTTGL